MYPLIICPLAPSVKTPKIQISLAVTTRHLKKTYLVSADVKVERSYRPAGRQSTRSARLNIVKYRVVAATTSSGTKGTDTLHTSLIVEDAGECLRHVDDGSSDGEFR